MVFLEILNSWFYDNSNSLGTKTTVIMLSTKLLFYDNSNSLGTKTEKFDWFRILWFYDNSNSLGTKTSSANINPLASFTITQIL